jgi:hypothetical protein
MKQKYLYAVLISMIFLFSCKKDIEFRGDDVKTKLVLNGLFTPDSLVKVNLSESRFFLDPSMGFKRIDDAIVELWKADSKIETLKNTGNGFYRGTYIPVTGDNLRITASCDGLDPIECSTEIVSPPTVLSVDTANYLEERQYWGWNEEEQSIDTTKYILSISSDINIRFNDTKNISDFYRISLYLRTYYTEGTEDYIMHFESDDVVFNTTGSDFSNAEYDIFNDELFDGKEYKLKIKTSGWLTISSVDYHYLGEYIRSELVVDFQHISQPYYMYLKTSLASNTDEMMQYFTEPILVYSNVTGGIGILGNYASSVYVFPLK